MNRIKAILARFGIRAFKPILRNAKQLESLRTVEGTLVPENTRAELSRNYTECGCYTNRSARSNASACAPLPRYLRRSKGRMRWFVSSRGSSGLASRRQTCWSMRFCRATYAIEEQARDAGLTGRGKRRREKGLARAGNARVRHGMILLGWRFLQYQKDSAIAQWFTARTADGRGGTRKTMIVALGRKLLIALWRLVTTGEIPTGVVLALHDARGGRQPIRRTGRGLLARIFRGRGAIAGSRELVVSVIFFEARVY
ncbi:hypothetical protein NKJ46_22825 [Mesorhizobium sp. M0166]|uniref:hypothetical protein n=1 Tax=Mesorhizobium sp. M0166 TaxID=2956902 RepID=UPI0033397EC1